MVAEVRRSGSVAASSLALTAPFASFYYNVCVRGFPSLKKPKVPLIDGAPSSCSKCDAPLCVRKQVINLALGNTEEMQCLKCLAKESESSESDVLKTSRGYVMERECFRKE